MDPRNTLLFVLSAAALGGASILMASNLHLPGNNIGYEPEQPIAFSHRLHAGELQIQCLYCHYGAKTSRHAGIPPAGICMNCHRIVTAGHDAVLEEKLKAEKEGREPRKLISPELAKLYDHLGLDDNQEPDPSKTPAPIEWIRVYNLPDFVYFDHRVHVNRGVACETCHGPVQSMERIRQFPDLSMGWCLRCHRSLPADPPAFGTPPAAGEERKEDHVSTDCSSCHY